MKTLLEYIIDNEKKYGFRVKIATELSDDGMKSLQNCLSKWKLEAISEPKRLPIAEEHTGFGHLKNTELYIIDLVVNYPCTPAEVQAAVHESTSIPLSHIMVVTPTQEVLAAPIVADSDSPVLTSDFPEQKEPQLLADLANALKTKSIEHQFAVKPTKGKTLNDIPQYNTSPLGTKKTKLPERPKTGVK
jgi:hypothetical protein